MIEGEYFFSTLAQSTATILGLVIALSGVIHQLERQEVRRNTDSLKEELSKLSNKYHDIFELLGREFSKNIEKGGWFIDPDEALNDPKEIKSEIYSAEDVENPNTVYIWHLISCVLYHLEEIRRERSKTEENLISLREMENLRSCSVILADIFRNIETNRELVEEFTSSNSTALDGMVREISDEEKLADPSTIIIDSSSTTESIRSWIKTRSTNRDDLDEIQGNEIQSLSYIFEEFASETIGPYFKSYDSSLDYDPSINSLIRGGLGLSFFGIFLPILCLMRVPPSITTFSLTGTRLVIFQLLLLLASIYFLYDILDNVWSNIDN